MNVSKTARCVVVALMAVVTFAGAVQTASAAPTDPRTDNLTALWKAVLQTPSDQNPFGTGAPSTACWNLGGQVVAPFGPSGAPSCTVPNGTKIFEAAVSAECSTFELTMPTSPCYNLSLAAGAESQVSTQMPTVTLNGQPVSLMRVETSAVPMKLPADNVLGVTGGGRGQFVAVGWVTMLGPLAPGSYTITGVDPAFTTLITVTR